MACHETNEMARAVRLFVTIIFALTFRVVGTFAQTPANSGPPPISPRDIVEEVWNMGVSGQLLTQQGWIRASRYFSEPSPTPSDKSFDVISNYNGFSGLTINNDKAEVLMEFTDAGHIGSNLHYSPPSPGRSYKTDYLFRLVLTPSFLTMVGPDGKTDIARKPTGQSAWSIEGPPSKPWTTVNTAIRHVLEIRNKTTDPVIRKNADETLTKLLKWN